MVSYIPVPPPSVLPSNDISSSLSNSEVHEIASNWTERFNAAVTTADAAAFDKLFALSGYWRDVIAFTSDIRSIAKPNIKQAASDRLSIAAARDVTITSPLPVVARPFPDVSFIEIHFTFDSKIGPGVGVAKLIPEQEGPYTAWVVFTTLDGIHGSPELTGAHRIRGAHNTKQSYDAIRSQEVENASPEVIIVGGGHNGLEVAARLNSLGIKSLVIDKYARIGDNWRLRYRSLSLHDPVWANHLAYMPFPPTWPIFTPSGKLANFLEYYVDVLEINVWTSSSVVPEKTFFDSGKWTVTINRDGVEHCFAVSHLVMATGLGGGLPKMPPPFKGQNVFKKPLLHSSQHGTGSDWSGKKALVVGACTSAHDISLDFFNNGADVTMLQRSPTYVMSVKNGMPIVNGTLFSEAGPPTELADRIAESTPKFVAKLFHQRIIPQIAALDADLLEGLKKAGFKITSGPDGSGFLMFALEKAGGYYFNTGCSERIISGDIKVKNGEIDYFTETSVVFKDGSQLHPDVVVFATGYTGFPDTLAEILGKDYAKLLKPVWSLDDEGELKSVYRDCGIPNMYYMVGNLSAARFGSKILAFQIAAERNGLLGDRYTIEAQARSEDQKIL
ncbi:uncharacterized protein V1516DRAFT_686999 [Lipomyces oligophaga]|uniref:uncharacterized protein n=1 Tax=Lipomyces oligophaga TaxID=45792 RepID=UPI0034CFE1ED